MSRRLSFLVWFVVIVVGAAVAQIFREWNALPPAVATHPGETIAGRARVVDGDSLEIAGRRIRMSGIDAPERDQTCRDAADREYACGTKARRALSDAIGGGEVSCVSTGSASYDRVVAVCNAGGRDLGETMVRGGHALELRNLSRGRYTQAEREARDGRRGVWEGRFERPAEWRREHPRESGGLR